MTCDAPAWWKAKHKLVLPVEVVRWGDWGQACVMAFAYRGVAARARRPPRSRGVLRNGLLRHPVYVARGR